MKNSYEILKMFNIEGEKVYFNNNEIESYNVDIFTIK